MRFNKLLLWSILGVQGCGLELPPSTGTYMVTSDCPGAKTNTGTLSINEEVGNVLSVMQVANAQDFGFPSEFFGYSFGGYFQVAGEPRTCKSQLFKKNTKKFMFLCRDNDTPVCTIAFKQ